MRIDGFAIDDVARTAVAAATSRTARDASRRPERRPPTPEQARALIDKIANVYGAIRVGKSEMRGLSINTPQGPINLAAIRFNLENGKIGEFAIESLDGAFAEGPDRRSGASRSNRSISPTSCACPAQFSNPAQKPAPDQLLGLLALLGGIEVRGVVAPFMDTGKMVNLDNFDLNWGQFVGPIPSRAPDAEDDDARRCQKPVDDRRWPRPVSNR